jgi:hypothetical protein
MRRIAIGCLLLSAALSSGCGGASGRSSAARNGDGAPELVLSGMVLTEVGPSGARYRLAADRSTYSLAGKTVTASGVVFGLRERGGDVRVTAPSVTWDVEGQAAAFPAGCEADYPGGYRAGLQVAELDLRERVLTASGPSTYSGPGFTVDGVDLVWRWREGKAELRQPKSVIVPGGIRASRRG